jgi:biopolymer transport protein ExbD
MAEILSKQTGKGRKKLSTRIDLTPMVDLGFLLITFFIFTTTMLKSNTMVVHMPSDEIPRNPPVVPHHLAMKIFLGKNHHVFYLKGMDAMNNNFAALKEVSFNHKPSLREAIAQHHADIRQAKASGLKGSTTQDQSFILVKPSTKADYSDIVNTLDELSISGVGNYALVEMDKEEKMHFESK